MPASPQRRTRSVAPVEDVEAPVLGDPEVPGAFAAPKRGRPRGAKNAAQLRRVQEAAADEKVRLPAGQRAAEIADGELAAPVAGRWFRLSDSIGLMPLMEWAAAREDVDAGNASTLVSFYRILQDIVHPDDWQAFKTYTREHKCNDEDLVAFQNAALEAIAARPTVAPADS
jgi:uncharacterized protein YbaR (Trm112 family)